MIHLSKEINQHRQLLFQFMVSKGKHIIGSSEFEKFYHELECGRISAKLSFNEEVRIAAYNLMNCVKSEQSRKISLFLGANSTLFNAGTGTNFIYEIKLKDGDSIDVDDFNRSTYVRNKITERILRLEERGARIEFAGIQSNTLFQNLRMIDGDLPQILAELLLVRYRDNESKLTYCVNKLQETNPMQFDLSRGWPFYEYKLKKFLQDVAMGMTPETVWTGIYDATGGQIIVKDSGDVVCYHIYEQNQFLNFLLNSTYFEQPATSEDSDYPGHPKPNPKKNFFFGWIYEENGKYFLKINLQVRMNA